MEEQRIGMMYLNLMKRWFATRWDELFPRGFTRSPALPLLIVALIVGLPGLGYYLHMRGQFHTLKREINIDQPEPTNFALRPGGAEPIVLSRTLTMGGNMPEFRSATILPGLGMDILQITASIPNHGETSLLADPPLEQMASGTPAPKEGLNDNRGAIELPWGGILVGMPTPVGSDLRVSWRNSAILAPAEAPGRNTASGGLLSLISADNAQQTVQALGPVTVGTFHGTNFNGRWPSKTDVSITVSLGPRILDLTVKARNIGDTPEPMGIGWHPRFVIPSGDRAGVEVRLPLGDEIEMADRSRGIPSGKIISAAEPLARFEGHATKLGQQSFDAVLANPKPALLDSGAQAEFHDPASAFGMRMIADTSSIRELRVSSPAGSNFVSLGTQTNFDDPLGHEWTGATGPAIVTLLPGQSLDFKVRLEIFSIDSHD